MKTIRCQINSQSCRKWKIKMKTPTVKARKLSRSLKTQTKKISQKKKKADSPRNTTLLTGVGTSTLTTKY